MEGVGSLPRMPPCCTQSLYKTWTRVCDITHSFVKSYCEAQCGRLRFISAVKLGILTKGSIGIDFHISPGSCSFITPTRF